MIIWILWVLFATIFYLLGLWSALECRRKGLSMQEARDLFKQALFITVCVVFAMVVDHFGLPIFKNAYLDDVGYGVARVLLLPLILMVAAVLIGPTKPIRVTRAPTLNRNRYPRR
jgi:hypothetical protein